YDHPAVDCLPHDCVRAADVVGALRCDRGCLDPETGLAQCGGGLQHDLIAGLAAPDQRQVEVTLIKVESEQVPIEKTQRLDEQLLPGLVSMQDYDWGHERHLSLRSGSWPAIW